MNYLHALEEFDDNNQLASAPDQLMLDEYDEKTKVQTRVLVDTLDTQMALEAIHQYLNKNGSSVSTNMMANVALESLYEKTNLNTQTLFSANGTDHKVALENILVDSRKLWFSIKDAIANLAIYIGQKMNSFKQNYSKLKNTIIRLETYINSVEAKEPYANVLKPVEWFSNLMYLDKSMPDGLKGIGKAVNAFIEEHRTLATNATKKYSGWLESNFKTASKDAKVFSTLHLSKDDFVFPGSTVFEKSVGRRLVKNDNVIYRSKELPGGFAFYTEVKPVDKNGMSSTSVLNDLNYYLAQYDPVSFKHRRLEMAKFGALSATFWLGAAVTSGVFGGIPLAAALGSGLYAAYQNHQAKVVDTGKQPHVSKESIFKTLTINECKNVLKDLKQGLVSLNRWYTDVFENNVKQHTLDKIFNEVFSKDRVDPTTNSGYRAIKRYCSGLINMIQAFTNGVHSYGFKIYTSLAQYVEKSIKQYK